MRHRASQTRSAPATLPSPLIRQFVAPAGTEDIRLLSGKKFSSEDPTIEAEQDKVIAGFTRIALSVRDVDPNFYKIILVMAQSLLGYEKEIQKVERKVRSLQVELDALRAIKSLEKSVNEQVQGIGEVNVLVRETLSCHVGSNLDRGNGVVRPAMGMPGVQGLEEVVIVQEDLADTRLARSCIELKDWPLPPSKKEWAAAGERKRKWQPR